MPTLCRCHVASAIDTPRVRQFARIVERAGPRRHRRFCLPVAPDRCPDRTAKPPERRSRAARRTPGSPPPAQPNPQIPINLRPHIAGSFLGDFRTPTGVRSSLRSGWLLSGDWHVRADIHVRMIKWLISAHVQANARSKRLSDPLPFHAARGGRPRPRYCRLVASIG
jgi:hypothetical protein